MDQECSRFSQNIRGLEKEMKTWDCYVGIEKEVKNLITSLRYEIGLSKMRLTDQNFKATL